MAKLRKTLASLSYLQNLHTKELGGWNFFQDSNTNTPDYTHQQIDKTLHIDGLKVATHNPVRVGIELTINKPKKLKTQWEKFSIDFRTMTLVKNYGAAENNLIIEISKHNTQILHKMIFNGSDEKFLKKFSGSKPFDSNWQNFKTNLNIKGIKNASKLTFKIYTLQNAFRPAKHLMLKNAYILRTPVSGENFPHLPDDHLRKILIKI